MKQVGTTHWFGPNTDATNSSGFTALPGGYRYDNGSYVERRGRSLVEFYSGQRNQRQVLGCEFVDVWGSVDKTFGLSVRCLRD
jgi:uncharacterized protein (TIGR02145 family)